MPSILSTGIISSSSPESPLHSTKLPSPSPPQPQTPSSAAQIFWSSKELRQELIEQTILKQKDLAGMMVLEKGSLPDVAKVLYREVKTVDLVQYLRDRGCAEIRIKLYVEAVQVVCETLSSTPLLRYRGYNQDMLNGFPKLHRVSISIGDLGESPWCVLERDPVNPREWLREGRASIKRSTGDRPIIEVEVVKHSKVFKDVRVVVKHVTAIRSPDYVPAPSTQRTTSPDLSGDEDLVIENWGPIHYGFMASGWPIGQVLSVITPQTMPHLSKVVMKCAFPIGELYRFTHFPRLLSIDFGAYSPPYRMNMFVPILAELMGGDSSSGNLPGLRFIFLPLSMDELALALHEPGQSSALQTAISVSMPRLCRLSFRLTYHPAAWAFATKAKLSAVFQKYLQTLLGGEWRCVEDVNTDIPHRRLVMVKGNEYAGNGHAEERQAEGMPGWRHLSRGGKDDGEESK